MSGDERVRVSLVKKGREFVAVEVVERNQIGFVFGERKRVYSRCVS